MAVFNRFHVIALAAALTLSGATASEAYTIRADSAMRQRTLLRASETAELILVGTVLDTMFVALPDIRTKYTVRVERLIKGPDTTLTAVSFTEPGGTVGSRSRTVCPSDRFDIGGTYLFFLTRCEDDIHYLNACPDCAALLEGDVAKVRNPHVTISATALLDSVVAFTAASDPARWKADSDLILVVRTVTVTETDSRPFPEYSPAVVDVAITDTVWQRSGSPEAPQTAFPIRILSPLRADGTASGTRPFLEPGSEYLVFLRWTTEGWVMGNSIYSAWRRVGDLAVLEVAAFPCRTPYVLASRSWAELLTENR